MEDAMRITAAVMERADGKLTKRKIELQEVELESPREHEVLVRITSCGVCGTDRGCIHGLEPYPTPGVLGHEGAGVVEEVGARVSLVQPGDRVMLGFPFCGTCRSCRRGQPRYCAKGFELCFSGKRLDGSSGMRTIDGEPLAARFFQQSSWATHTLALEHQLAKVPDELDLDLTGPYGCSISTGAGTVLNELKPEPGSSIAIFGAGNVGLAAVMAARLSGATTIIAVDTNPERLKLARELGATHTLEQGLKVVPEIKALTRDELDYSIEATPGANVVAEAVLALGIRGTCAMVGGAKMTETVKISHPDTLLHGKRLIGVMGGGGQSPMFLESLMKLQVQGRFPLEKLVRFYDFAEINQAIDDSDRGVTVKPVLRMRHAA
jgi:aryl-alcohol dehydrogenase